VARQLRGYLRKYQIEGPLSAQAAAKLEEEAPELLLGSGFTFEVGLAQAMALRQALLS
jgi:hypothetical protein